MQPDVTKYRLEADQALEALRTQLQELASDPHEATALAARALCRDLIVGRDLTAQTYQRLHLGIHQRQQGSVPRTRPQWRELHATSCQVLAALVRLWRTEILSARDRAATDRLERKPNNSVSQGLMSPRQNPDRRSDTARATSKPKRGLDPSIPLSVSRVADRLREIIDDRLRDVQTVWIEGEITDLRLAPRGTLRFTLCDSRSRIECVWWEAAPETAAIVEGARAVVLATPKVFTRAVSLVCVVREVRPSGIGDAAAAHERAKGRLEADGLFDHSRKRALPRVPRGVAVIAAPSSAAWHDVLAIAQRRHPGVRIVLVAAKMQGAAAGPSLRTALQRAAVSDLCDVVIITRGGGSAADLSVFDDEDVARAIAACEVPVVTAIGHETDFTLADAVADRREATPSAAAARVIPDRLELIGEVRRYRRTFVQSFRVCLEREIARLRNARVTIGHSALTRTESARRRLDRTRREVDHALADRLRSVTRRLVVTLHGCHNAVERTLERQHARFRRLEHDLANAITEHTAGQASRHARVATQLQALDPLAVLSRGFSVVRSATGKVVTSAHDVLPGAQLMVQFRDGTALMVATHIHLSSRGEQ